MHRSKISLKPTSVLAIYVLAATGSGLLVGALVGWGGSLLDLQARAATATALAIPLLGLSAASLHSAALRPLQCDRETPQRWVHQGPVLWPLKNGAALGFGATSRLGFALWYAIPLGALLSGSPALGALLWAVYGFMRSGSAGTIWLLGTRAGTFDAILEWLPAQKQRAQLLSNAVLMSLSVSTFFAVGL